jgi:hypothetical protein
LPTQNDHDSRFATSSLTLESSPLKDPRHESGASTNLAALGRFMLRLQHGKAEKSVQLLCDGGYNKGDAPQLPTPQDFPCKDTSHKGSDCASKSNPLLRGTSSNLPFSLHPDFSSRNAGSGFGFGGLDTVVALDKWLVKTS